MGRIEEKAIIVSLRSQGYSFQKISDILKNEYNIEKTRQACCSVYNRVMSDKEKSKRTEIMSLAIDIINYYSLGISEVQLCKIINASRDEKSKVSSYKIHNIIVSNSDYIQEVLEDKVGITEKFLRDTGGISNSNKLRLEELVRLLEYNGIKPTRVVLNRLLEKASQRLIAEYKENIQKQSKLLT